MADDASSSAQLTDEVIAEVANAAAADTRSVMRRLLQLPVRGKRAAVIDRELERRGFITGAR